MQNGKRLSPGRGLTAGAPICNATLRYRFIYYSALQTNTKAPNSGLGSSS